MKKLLILPIYYTVICLVAPYITMLVMTPAVKALPAPEATPSDTVEVFNPADSTTTTMTMTDYLTGVVAAEMPAAFEVEALKAQAVAARTYALYKASKKEHDGDVCTDYTHCQAYITTAQMQENWGSDYELYYKKIHDAVKATEGEYIAYEEEPVMAVFHSMGGGYTENSSDVWGEHVPYLVSVESPGEEAAANYNSTLEMPFESFKAIIMAEFPDATLSSPMDVSEPVLTDGGHVKSIIIGSVNISGTKMRSLFSLRSTKFTLSFENDKVIFSVTGYGHGVGMSQYGANAMAKEGKTYREILTHYYSGTTICE